MADQYLDSHGPGTPPADIVLAPAPVLKVRDGAAHPHALSQRIHRRLKAAGLPGMPWIGSPNYTPGRPGGGINGGAQHTMVGTVVAARARFGDPASQVSTHVGFLEDGTIEQYVSFDNTAWANGSWPGNVNLISGEREDSGNYNRPLSANPKQAMAMAVFWTECADTYGWAKQHSYLNGICGHKEVPGSSTACPDGIDMTDLVHLMNGGTIGPTTPPWDRSYPMPDPPPAGTEVDVTYNGVVNQGASWYVSPNGDPPNPAPDPSGQTVTVTYAAFDGVNWWDRIGGPGSWWLKDSDVDASSDAHPPPTGLTPPIAWNEANAPTVVPNPAPAPVPPVPTPVPAPVPTPPTPSPPTPPAPGPPAPTPPPVAGKSVWQAILDFFARLFGGGKTPGQK